MDIPLPKISVKGPNTSASRRSHSHPHLDLLLSPSSSDSDAAHHSFFYPIERNIIMRASKASHHYTAPLLLSAQMQIPHSIPFRQENTPSFLRARVQVIEKEERACGIMHTSPKCSNAAQSYAAAPQCAHEVALRGSEDTFCLIFISRGCLEHIRLSAHDTCESTFATSHCLCGMYSSNIHFDTVS